MIGRVLVTLNAADHGRDLTFQVRERHLRMLKRAGFLPILAPGSLEPEQVNALLEISDALYLPGGDYLPERLEEPEQVSTRRAAELGMPWDPCKVALDRLALRSAWERQLPTLAICGGFQSMAVMHGGELRSSGDGLEETERESIELSPETLAARIFGSSLEVNSFHRQAVERLGDALRVSARGAGGTIEAIEAPSSSHPFWLGLEWHPELMDDERPYQALAHAVSQLAS